MKTVSIIILHFKEHTLTKDCLLSLSKLNLSGISVKVIVINNGNINPWTQSKVANLDISIINNVENYGYAKGNNIGIQKALASDEEYIWILNNDTITDKNCLYELIKVMDNDSNLGMVSPKIYFAKGYEFHKDRYSTLEIGKVIWWAGGYFDRLNVQTVANGIDEVDNGQFDITSQNITYINTQIVPGTAMLVRRSVFEKLGLFDEAFFLYFEDTDFCLRIKQRSADIKFGYVPRAIIWHKSSGSSSSGSDLHDYYLTRNRLIIGKRYTSMRTQFALLRESVKFLINGRKWQKRGVIDYFLGRLGKGSYEQ